MAYCQNKPFKFSHRNISNYSDNNMQQSALIVCDMRETFNVAAGVNTFTAIVDLSRFNNSYLKSPASTFVDLTFQSRALRSFSLNQLRNLSL